MYQYNICSTIVITLLLVASVARAADGRKPDGQETRSLKPVAAEALAVRRTALVIGNATYTGAALRNAENDADDMATALQSLGFAVTKLLNADKRQMVEAINSFSAQLHQGGVGLFYFAGHGAQLTRIIHKKAQTSCKSLIE